MPSPRRNQATIKTPHECSCARLAKGKFPYLVFGFWRVSKLRRVVSQFLPPARQDVQPLRLCDPSHYIWSDHTYKCYALTPRKFHLLGIKSPNKLMTMPHLNTRYNSRRGSNRTFAFARNHSRRTTVTSSLLCNRRLQCGGQTSDCEPRLAAFICVLDGLRRARQSLHSMSVPLFSHSLAHFLTFYTLNTPSTSVTCR